MSDRRAKNGISSPKPGARKRAQNRISQQCRRERTSVKAQRLKHALSAIQTTSDAPDADRYSALLQAYLKLVEENEELEDALMRLRKRMLSMSNTAASGADDPIFQKLFKKRTQEDVSVSSQVKPHDTTIRITPEQSDSTQPVTEGVGGQSSVYMPQTMFGDITFQNISNSLAPDLSNWMNFESVNWDASVLTGDANPDMSTEVSVQPNIGAIHIRSPMKFADHVLDSCRKYLQCGLDAGLTEPGLSEQLASAAIRLLSRSAGVETYVYGTGRAEYLKKIVQWRLSNAPDDCAAIPPQFAPTPLQRRPDYSAAQHNLLIDFICWPEMRDKIILHSQNLDLDELQRDISLSTVIEIPQREISLNIMDVFHTCSDISKSNHQGTNLNYLRDFSWVFYQVTKESESSADIDYGVESALFQDITSFMQQNSASDIIQGLSLFQPDPSGSVDWATTTYWSMGDIESGISHPNNPNLGFTNMTRFFGLHGVTSWKIAKEFGEKYPMLDCSSDILSVYQTAPPEQAAETIIGLGGF